MYILSFKIKKYQYGKLIKHKSRLCDHGGMNQWGMNNLETYYPVANWMPFRDLINLIIQIEFHTKSVDFVLAYTQSDVKP